MLSTLKPLNVNVSVSESEDMVASAEEGAKTVSFALGATTATLSVPTVDDNVDETNSVITATIQANTDYTVGTSSAPTVTVTDNDVPETLGPPTNLRATPGNEQVTLRWTAPANTGGEPITDYEYEQDGDGNWSSTGGTTTSYTVRNLTNGQSYTFRVRAVNRLGAHPGAVQFAVGHAEIATTTAATRGGGAPDGSDGGGGRRAASTRWC